MIFCVSGACRGGEFTQVETNHIQTQGDLILVKIPDTKTKVPRSFTIEGEMAQTVRKYMELRPPKTTNTRFFLKYKKGKCNNQVIGKHSFEKMPNRMAGFLQLPDPQKYTGHSFRRTSATLLADAGANITTLKRHGGWRSAVVTEGNNTIYMSVYKNEFIF